MIKSTITILGVCLIMFLHWNLIDLVNGDVVSRILLFIMATTSYYVWFKYTGFNDKWNPDNKTEEGE